MIIRPLVVSLAFATVLLVSGALSHGAAGAAVRSGSGHQSTTLAIHVRGNHLVSASGKVTRLLGVDVTGTENSCVKTAHVSKAPISKSEAETIAKWGANAVRVPLNEDCWLGINGLPAHYSSSRYRSSIEHWVSDLNSVGIVVILDLHWSAPGNVPANKQGAMPDETHSVTFWSDVARQFKSDPGVVFDLFNEPALGGLDPTQSDWTCWRNGCTATVSACTAPTRVAHVKGTCTAQTFQIAGMQQILDAVRKAGAHQPVMVGGLHWAGAPCGRQSTAGSRGTCMWLKYRPSDPDHQLVVSYHTYNFEQCNSATCWSKTLLPVTRDFPVVTGELGEKACSSTYVSSYMKWADDHGISYLVWAWQIPTASLTCANQGTRLVTTWTGRTNEANPVAGVVQAHLRAELRRLGRHF